MYINRPFLPFGFVSFLPYATTYLPALSPCSCFLFRFSTLFLYPPFSISCNTILHTHLYSCTYLSVAQVGYPPLGPIRNTLLCHLPLPQQPITDKSCLHFPCNQQPPPQHLPHYRPTSRNGMHFCPTSSQTQYHQLITPHPSPPGHTLTYTHLSMRLSTVDYCQEQVPLQLTQTSRYWRHSIAKEDTFNMDYIVESLNVSPPLPQPQRL